MFNILIKIKQVILIVSRSIDLDRLGSCQVKLAAANFKTKLRQFIVEDLQRMTAAHFNMLQNQFVL